MSAVYPSLKDKRVVITGGGSGIGEAFVDAFVRQGARVCFLDIAEAPSRALVERLSGAAFPPEFLACDLTCIDALRDTIDSILNIWGAADILVNNAANDDRHTLEQVTAEYWDNRMAVNLRHLFFAAQAVAPGMKAQGSGVILNIGSISWHVALPDIVLYQTAKAGIEGMTRGLARDLGGSGIRVNTIVPGGIVTPRQDLLWHDESDKARIVNAQCLKARVTPEDVAAMALFLASDDARMCTAHSYFVDAGWR